MRPNTKKALSNGKGMTLIELLVVIAVIGILIVALAFSYQGWQVGYRVESTIREIYSDMMNARMQAMTKNMAYFADFPAGIPQVYRIFQDTNGNLNPDPGAGDNILQPFPKSIEHTITRGWGNPADVVMFEIRGTMQTAGGLGGAICIDNIQNPNLAGITRDYDCIIIGQTRINMGLLTDPAGACNANNCRAK